MNWGFEIWQGLSGRAERAGERCGSGVTRTQGQRPPLHNNFSTSLSAEFLQLGKSWYTIHMTLKSEWGSGGKSRIGLTKYLLRGEWNKTWEWARAEPPRGFPSHVFVPHTTFPIFLIRFFWYKWESWKSQHDENLQYWNTYILVYDYKLFISCLNEILVWM